MAPILVAHICAGSLSIVSGAAALSVRKGSRLHRVFGTVFVLSMLSMAVLAIYLAAFVPPVARGAPPAASIAVAVLTFYLVATAWMTVRRAEGRTGVFEKGAFVMVLGVAVALVLFGLRAVKIHEPLIAPYFVFAGFAALAAALDLKVILRGGISGRARIARHLWRMCFALFFAAAFFFIGQQKVMPPSLHGAPILFVPAFAPLAVMVFWLVRTRFWKRFDGGT